MTHIGGVTSLQVLIYYEGVAFYYYYYYTNLLVCYRAKDSPTIVVY